MLVAPSPADPVHRQQDGPQNWESAWPARRQLDDGNKEDFVDKGGEIYEDEEADVERSDVSAIFATQQINVSSRVRSRSPGRLLVPPAIPSEAPHSVGEQVEYWSATHKQWMPTKVSKVNYDSRGVVTTYDLEVKRGAAAEKIRRKEGDDARQISDQLSSKMVQNVPTPVSNTAAESGNDRLPATAATPKLSAVPPKMGEGSALAARNNSVIASSDPPPDLDMSREQIQGLRVFDPGEQVQYWSDTYTQWMNATVEKVRSDMVTYDLDVKRGAQRKKMRSAPRRSPAGADVMPTSVPAVPTASSRAQDAAPAGFLGTALASAKSGSPVRPGAGLGSINRPGAVGTITGLGLNPIGTIGNFQPQGSHVSDLGTAGAPLRNAQRDATTSSRLRALSRETVYHDNDEAPKLANAPERIEAPGGYPRSGSPLLGDKTIIGSASEKAGAGASQTAPVGDLTGVAADGRPRLFPQVGQNRAPGTVNRANQDLGRPGPVGSGSVGLAAGGNEPTRPTTQGTVTPNALGGPRMVGATRRVLPDSSGGPTIGTRPDGNASGIGAAATNGLLGTNGIRKVGPNSFAPGTGNPAEKTVGANGFAASNLASGQSSNEKPRATVQREGDKLVMRQLPGTAAPLNTATSSASSHRPQLAGNPAPVPSALSSIKSEGEAPLDGDGLNDILEGATGMEMTMLTRQLLLEQDDLDVTAPLMPPREQVTAALSRVPEATLRRRLGEAGIDSSAAKNQKELERLLVTTLLTRIRSTSAISEPVAAPPAAEPPRVAAANGFSAPTPASSSTPPKAAGAAPAAGSSCASQLVATGFSGASVTRSADLEVAELDIGSGQFDPTAPALRNQIVTMLGLSQSSTIEEMTGFRGGLNEGVWFLNDPTVSPASSSRELVLKLVKCTRIAPRIPTEAENFVKVYQQSPKIIADPTVAFPVRIFKCHGPAPERQHRYDLIVMWKCRGERLAEFMAHKWYSKHTDELWAVLERLGRCLAEFHLRYPDCQHGDFQPSNVFYEEESQDISFIDIGGMGVPTAETDMEHFGKSLKLLAESYGSQLILNGQRSLERGYQSVIPGR